MSSSPIPLHTLGAPGQSRSHDEEANNPKERSPKLTRGFHFLLDPLILWITRRHLRAKVGLPSGFPRIASFIASDPDHLATVFKRFDTLGVRNLLLLEARVAALEAIQVRLDEEDLKKRSDNFAVSYSTMSLEYLACLAYPKEGPQPSVNPSQTSIPEYALEKWREDLEGDKANWREGGGTNFGEKEIYEGYFQKRWDVAIAIQRALKEYHEALLLQGKVLKLDSPTKRTTEALQRWVGAATEKKKLDLEFSDKSAAFKLFDIEGDLISLHPPGDDDNGTRLVARLFQYLLSIYSSIRRRKESQDPDEDEIYDEISEDGIRRFTTVGTFFVAIGFLMGAVWLIRRIGLDETQVATKYERELVVITVFTAVFGIWVAIFTSAKRAEIFGATAAYAAVLIVFVGGNPS